MITGAIITFVALLLGFVAGRITMPSRPAAITSGAGVCGCDHNKAFHDPKTGICHGQMKNPNYTSDYYVSKSNPKQIQCSCKQYAPEAGSIEEMYHALASAPPIIPREIE